MVRQQSCQKPSTARNGMLLILQGSYLSFLACQKRTVSHAILGDNRYRFAAEVKEALIAG
jgi:hypothetical protein